MNYEPKTWTCGETITADELNRMEDGIANAGGYECSESRVVLTEENINATESSGTYFALLSYSTPIDDNEIIVTFDGNTYTLQKKRMGTDGDYYGDISGDAPDYTRCPFVVFASAEGNAVYTETEGAHSIKIEAVQETVETTPCFEKAVSKFNAPLMINIKSVDEEHSTIYLDKKFDEVLNAYLNGRNCILNYHHEEIPSLLIGYFLVTQINIDRYEVATTRDTLKKLNDGYLYISGAN